MEKNDASSEFTLRVEYIEIYNEELRDLLHPETTSKVSSFAFSSSPRPYLIEPCAFFAAIEHPRGL
jgi:hypothetical protein